MTYAGDWKSLLGGGGGQQRTGAAEQNPFQFSLIELIQQIAAEGNGAAAAAGTAGMDILYGVVKNQGPAISESSAQG